MHDILISARHVLAMNAFANKSTLAFLKAYRGEDIRIVDNRYHISVVWMKWLKFYMIQIVEPKP
jgi:hypothetical protein